MTTLSRPLLQAIERWAKRNTEATERERQEEEQKAEALRQQYLARTGRSEMAP